MGCATLTALRPFLRHEPDPPPVLFQLPAFTLVAPDGRPFGSADLRGQVYVTSFFFTRCASICPPLMQAIKRLDTRLRAQGETGIRLVSITVDPEHDTPERLHAYGAAVGADPARWTLLTAPHETLEPLLVRGFKVPADAPVTASSGLVDVAHSGKLVLVDAAGRVRGYYDTDPMGLDEVFHRARHVRDE